MALNLEFFVSNNKEFFSLPNKNFSDPIFFAKIAKEGDILSFFVLSTKLEKCLNLELKNQSLKIYDYRLMRENGTFAGRRELCKKYIDLLKLNRRPDIMFYPVCNKCGKITDVPSDVQFISDYGICKNCWINSLIPEEKNEDLVA
jgi:hypothetical protein